MKILLIGNLIEDRQESMHRFTRMLQTGLSARGHTVSVIAPTLFLGRLAPHYRYNGIPKFLGYFDKFIVFPWKLRRRIWADRPDVVHITDQAGAVYRSAACGVPVVTTCHDLLQIRAALGEVPQQRISSFGRRYQKWIAASIARLENVVCVSSHTRSELVRLFNEPKGCSEVVWNSLNYPYQAIAPEIARARLTALARKLGLAESLFAAPGPGYILQVGGLQWYKNRDGLIDIFTAVHRATDPAPNLIMVGPPLESRHSEKLAAQKLSDTVIVLQSVSNEELEALYNLAECLLFPSLEEGFGWPIAEAQACGCPVFASNRSPMTEVGGAFCVYFDPTEAEAAARSIVAAWPHRRHLRDPALEYARKWQPTPMLESYEEVYQAISL